MDAENGKEADYENGFHRPDVNGTFNGSLQHDKVSETFENVLKLNNNVTSGSELKEEPSLPSEIHTTSLLKVGKWDFLLYTVMNPFQTSLCDVKIFFQELRVKEPGDSKKSKPLKSTGKIKKEKPIGSRHGAAAELSRSKDDKNVLKSSDTSNGTTARGCRPREDVDLKEKSQSFKKKQETDHSKAAGDQNNCKVNGYMSIEYKLVSFSYICY